MYSPDNQKKASWKAKVLLIELNWNCAPIGFRVNEVVHKGSPHLHNITYFRNPSPCPLFSHFAQPLPPLWAFVQGQRNHVLSLLFLNPLVHQLWYAYSLLYVAYRPNFAANLTAWSLHCFACLQAGVDQLNIKLSLQPGCMRRSAMSLYIALLHATPPLVVRKPA